jgi:DNA invertase Pin-like site-specific DNA recombinase/predicted DNA-binding transcriptional regulator AlpA
MSPAASPATTTSMSASMSAAGVSTKIGRRHLDRVAVVYVRQSTLAQVREHVESTARQYALAEQAVALGWDRRDVVVIDADLGVSGRSTEGRDGFRGLVSRVCLGEVGAIFGLEISRLARSSADLSRLLELARLTDTLLVDGDGVYDLADFNDRLLLGLKGTMSEAELHLLAGRLQGAKRAAAARGELRTPLPVGYVYDGDGYRHAGDDVGGPVIDPDEEVATAIRDVFAAFTATGSAYQVVAAFAGRRFPLRAYGGVWAGQLRWGRLTHARVLGILNNPCYAGAYVFGRYASRRTVRPDGSIHSGITLLPMDQWQVLIRDHHPGYLSWEDFLANQAKIAANRTHCGARPAREGDALCQGIIGCGSCGRPMSTRYHRDGTGAYECHARRDQLATPTCRSVSARAVDELVAERLLGALTPDEVALAFAAADEVTDRRARAGRAAELAVERARYDADRAERAFHAAEPENRLVMRTLEARWETRLAALAEAEAALEVTRNAAPPLPARADLQALVGDLPRLWHADTTSARDRKRLLRTLIADLTVLPETDRAKVRVGIRWHTGATDEITADRPRPPIGATVRTPAAAVELVRALGPTTSNNDLVTTLNQAGHRTGRGRPFDIDAVQWVRHVHHIPTPGPLAPGEVSVAQAAARLGITADAVYYWIKAGHLPARRGTGNRLAITWTSEIEAACRARIASSGHLTPKSQPIPAGGAV